MSFMSISIIDHTTASLPRPHVLYYVDVQKADGTTTKIAKRYSDVSIIIMPDNPDHSTHNFAPQFQELHYKLGDKQTLPPKRILVTTFLPSAWVDDKIIAERKVGLTAYLNNLIKNAEHSGSPILRDFLSGSSPTGNDKEISLEDALPSTLSRKAALAAQAKVTAASPIAAAYYPDWSADSIPPESLDYSKFDILFFGGFMHPCSL